MAVKLGNGNWAVKEDKLLAYNDNSGKFFNKEFDFARGSIATYVGKDGLIKSAASDVPRIDFSDSTKGALLLEPQSTNLLPYSEQFDNASWTKVKGGVGIIPDVTSNFAISPDGNLNASRVQFNLNGGTTVSDFSRLRFLNLTATNPTISLFIKSNNSSTHQLGFSYGGDSVFLVTAKPNEWTRVDKQTTASGSFDFRLELRGSQTTGDSSDVLIWGAQAENQSYATSTIPTSGSTTTRLADVCNNSGSAQDFNSEEGVLYCEIAALADDGTTRRFSISDGTNNNRVVIGYSSSNRFQFVISDGGSVVLNQLKTVSDITQFNKIALFYKLNDCAIWINGQKVGVDTIATMPSGLNTINFNQGSSSENLFGSVRDLQVFTTALTDEQLAALTTI